MTEQPRIPPVAAELLEPQLGALNVARTVAHNPALLKAWGEFARYILGPDLSLTPRQRELAILRVGWNHRADYEWAHHVAIAHSIEMSDEDIQAVRAAPGSCGLNPLESLILRAADEIYSEREISEASWRALAADLSHRQMLDLVFTIGQYTMVCIALNSIKVGLEEGFSGIPEA